MMRKKPASKKKYMGGGAASMMKKSAYKLGGSRKTGPTPKKNKSAAKKVLSKTPAGLGAKVGAKVKGYMDSKKKKDSSKYIKYLDGSDRKKNLERFKKYGSPKGYHRRKGSRG